MSESFHKTTNRTILFTQRCFLRAIFSKKKNYFRNFKSINIAAILMMPSPRHEDDCIFYACKFIQHQRYDTFEGMYGTYVQWWCHVWIYSWKWGKQKWKIWNWNWKKCRYKTEQILSAHFLVCISMSVSYNMQI